MGSWRAYFSEQGISDFLSFFYFFSYYLFPIIYKWIKLSFLYFYLNSNKSTESRFKDAKLPSLYSRKPYLPPPISLTVPPLSTLCCFFSLLQTRLHPPRQAPPPFAASVSTLLFPPSLTYFMCSIKYRLLFSHSLLVNDDKLFSEQNCYLE